MTTTNTIILDRESIEHKIDNGEALTEEERHFRRGYLAEDQAQRNSGQYDKPKVGEGSLWPSNDPSKDHIGATPVEVKITDPVTKEERIIEVLVVLYNTWAFSDRRMESKKGKLGHRVYIAEAKPRAAAPQENQDHSSTPEDGRTQKKAPVTTEKGELVGA